MPEWTFYIETYGCKVNQYESQQLREAWQALGGLETADPAKADHVCINSCAITDKAERDARNAVYRLRRAAPGAHIVLCGCAAQFFPDFRPRKKANWAEPDLIIPQTKKPVLLNGPCPGPDRENLPEPGPLAAYGRARPVIKIQDGCTQNCAYCIVPSTRGRPRSRAPEDILAECRGLLAKGYGELVISGVNLRQYGCGGQDFWSLLEYLDRNLAPEWHDRARLRISSLEPGQLGARGLEILAASRLACPHIHLSLQHASPAVLERMGRGHYDMEKVLISLEKLSAFWPLMGTGADIIAGFPGESEEDLQILLDFVRASPLSYGHVFPYSRRPGTRAMSMAGQITRKNKKERAERVRAALESKKRDFLARQLALPSMKIVQDLNSREKDGLLRGVNEYYAPCYFQAKDARACETGLFEMAPAGLIRDGLLVRPL